MSSTTTTTTEPQATAEMPACPRNHREDNAKARCRAYWERHGALNPRHVASGGPTKRSERIAAATDELLALVNRKDDKTRAAVAEFLGRVAR
jgi:hypothetical protein